MSFLLEHRKVNDIDIPLYFKFSTIIAKDNLTADKLLTLENWTNIFDELNPLLASDPSNSKKSKTFEFDSGRLSVKARWTKISDSSDVGHNIIEILNLSSVGKYFLKIDVRLSSYLERIASDLEQKKKSIDVKTKSKDDGSNSSKRKKSKDRKISDMLPKIRKEKEDDAPALLNEAATTNVLEDLLADNSNKVDDHSPLPKAALDTALTTTDTFPTCKSEKCIPTEMAAFHPECSSHVLLKAEKSTDEGVISEPIAGTHSAATQNPEKSLPPIKLIERESGRSENSPTSMSGKPIKEKPVGEPTTARDESADDERTNRILKMCSEFAFSSDVYSLDDLYKITFSPPKRKMDLPPTRGKAWKDKENSKSKKTKLDGDLSRQESTGGDGMRTEMTQSVGAILATYSEHEQYLTELYDRHIMHISRSYKPIDIPDLIALDIVSTPQYSGMIDFLEHKLVRDPEREHNYSDIIFDLLVPEWALAIFRTKHNCSRAEALEKLRLQSVDLINDLNF